MGNYVSEHKRPSATVDGDVCEFRVYIHRRNKFIHAWMKVTPREIIVQRSKTDIVVFPLQYLRRYGYTSAGVFFFESGRRCSTGEGLHTFQSQHAETIFHMVQARVQDTANAARAEWALSEQRRRDMRTGSVDHTPRIHPVQRYLSERNNEFSTFNQPNYNSLHAGEMKRRRQMTAPMAPRPRSLPGIEDTRLIAGPQMVANTHGHAQIIGNIISESSGPNKGSVSSLYNPSLSTSIHSYSNVSPRQHCPSATTPEYTFRTRCPSASSNHSTISNQSFQSTPSTPTTKVFPIQWDGGAGSTSFLCYANSTPITPSSERSASFTPTFTGNDEKSSLLSTPPTARNPLTAAIAGINGISLDERTTPVFHGKHSPTVGTLPRTTRQLNYASMEAPLATAERTSRSPSVTGSCVSLPQNSTSYAVIDPERTKALQQARDDVARSNLGHPSPKRATKRNGKNLNI